MNDDPISAIQNAIDTYVNDTLPPGGAVVVGLICPSQPYSARPQLLIAQNGAVSSNDHSALTVDGNTYFNIGSVTKTFTATNQTLINGNQNPDVWGKIGGIVPFLNLPPRVNALVLEQIGKYQSGFVADNCENWLPGAPQTLAQLTALLQGCGVFNGLPQHPPGACYSYSNLSWGLLALCGINLAAPDDDVVGLWAKAIFNCIASLGLAMPNTLPFPAIGENAPPNFPAGFTKSGKPQLLPPGIDYNPDPPTLGGGGNITSTGFDMYEWLAFHMGYSDNANSPGLQQVMQGTSYTAPGACGCYANATTGLGWFLPAVAAGDRAYVAKDGGVLGFTSYMAFETWVSDTANPAPNGVVVLTNSHAAGGASALGRQFIQLLLGNQMQGEEPSGAHDVSAREASLGIR